MDFGLSAEQERFRDEVRAWVDEVYPKERARASEGSDSYPEDLWQALAEAGYHGIGVGKEHGGSDMGVVEQVIFTREIARSLAGLTWTWATSAFCGTYLIRRIASQEQRDALLPGFASGKIRAGVAVTELAGGTDALGAMRTTAEQVDGGWRINGEKAWSSADADYVVTMAHVGELNPRRPALGKTLFLVPRDTPGITLEAMPKIGMRSLESFKVTFADVFVPTDLVLGEVGKGFYEVAGVFAFERILAAAMSLGMLDGVLEDAVAHMKEREAFGGPIGRFQILQHYVADMLMWQRQAELLTYFAAWSQEHGDARREANMAKVVASEYAFQAADHGVQILGGMGYSYERDMQRYWRDSRLLRFAPITNEMSRNQLAESLGLPRSFVDTRRTGSK